MNREGTFLYIEWFDDEGLHSRRFLNLEELQYLKNTTVL